MKFNGVKVYLAQRMTGRYQDEVWLECKQALQVLDKAGFEVLSPVLEEGIQPVHKLIGADMSLLRQHWKRDKEMLREAHIMLDLGSEGKSDGVNVEMGYTRFFMFKPLIRIHPTLGCAISRIEYDCVCQNIETAVWTMLNLWGTKGRLFLWRLKMLIRCFPKFLFFQMKFLGDCI